MNLHRLLIVILCFPWVMLGSAGKVYLVLGSDTAIWDGMNTGRYHCTYNPRLYTDPGENAYAVMASSFRDHFYDSYGNGLKLTWWMMAGNIFRYATNTNIPLANIMTLYLMKAYHGDAIAAYGDELSLHYHTFTWTDYDQDGIYWWNQAKDFNECRDDFDVTLCQFLLEEEVFPVSFRSGWHYMDNNWQHYLDQLLPYCMHNDWPHKRTSDPEPIDNIYDWSLAPAEFVPFRPSYANYQLPGDGPGWNVRSIHFGRAISQNILLDIFKAANQGVDQVACIWGHLPETDFLDNLLILDSLAHQAEHQYPEVKFRYCSAIEVLQRYRNTSDMISPKIDFNIDESGEKIGFTIESDEPLFQNLPFVAVKDIYERYYRWDAYQTAENRWQSTSQLTTAAIAKIGLAVCDTLGNQTILIRPLLPDDQYLDNTATEYQESWGNWSATARAAWKEDARQATLTTGDSAVAQWTIPVTQSGLYNIFSQIPEVPTPAERYTYRLFSNSNCRDTVAIQSGLPAYQWNYLGTYLLEANTDNRMVLSARGDGQDGAALVADVLKVSPLVKKRQLTVQPQVLDLELISRDRISHFTISLFNSGIEPVTINDVYYHEEEISIDLELPIQIAAMDSGSIRFSITPREVGILQDTIYIESNDILKPIIKVPCYGQVENYFELIDNEDAGRYHEEGEWYYSVAQAYGNSSRYTWLNQTPHPSATFTIELSYNGIYEIFEIVPKTENATNKALYRFYIAETILDSVWINQNAGSGAWVSLGRYYLPKGIPIGVQVIDKGGSTAGTVLRADAIKIALDEEISNIEHPNYVLPDKLHLAQNYPNPFNAATTIRYSLPEDSHIKLKIIDMLGREVATLVDRSQAAGNHKITWRPSLSSSSLYFYQLITPQQQIIKKMMIVK